MTPDQKTIAKLKIELDTLKAERGDFGSAEKVIIEHQKRTIAELRAEISRITILHAKLSVIARQGRAWVDKLITPDSNLTAEEYYSE